LICEPTLIRFLIEACFSEPSLFHLDGVSFIRLLKNGFVLANPGLLAEGVLVGRGLVEGRRLVFQGVGEESLPSPKQRAFSLSYVQILSYFLYQFSALVRLLVFAKKLKLVALLFCSEVVNLNSVVFRI